MGTGAPRGWPLHGCGRPATPPMERAPAKAPATAKGSGPPRPPTTASAGIATSVSMAPRPPTPSLRYIRVTCTRSPLEPAAEERGILHKDAGMVQGTWRRECPVRIRKGLETGKAAGVDTLCSSGFAFFSHLSHLIFFLVSQFLPSLFWRPAQMVA